MLDKTLSLDAIVGELRDGMTIGIGGWATRRKPMALVRAILRSGLRDLTIVSYGGPDVGMLVADGRVRKLVFAFVSLDHYPLDPHFRAARQAGLAVQEMDEGMFHLGLRAAAMRVPFLPTRIGIGTDLLKDPAFRLVKSPYDDGETFVAMPALPLDAAVLHVHRADRMGNVLTFSPDPFFDELMARAAERVFVTTETIVPTGELDMAANARFNPFERSVVTAVAEAPYGAHPTSAAPDYQLDLAHLKTYVDSAASPDAWASYRDSFIRIPAENYTAAVGGLDRIDALPKPVY